MSNKPNARDAIVDSATRLFFTQGYHATGLSQIIKDSDSPKGSLYYYFPHGKEELALTCINKTSEIVARQLRHYVEKDVNIVQAVQEFIMQMVKDAEESDYTGIVPFSFWVAVETSCISEELRTACQAVFKDWQDVIMQRLLEEGSDSRQAADRASVVVSLFEGALLQTLTCRSTVPLLAAARMVPVLLG
ncbi:TetR/AcrR family transcriptional regulator [Paenibacillus sp. HW567]|uniref:TetR/AcrR family transcriptional regulator n=1 Tax=Paenibacillus sp. HW567 TaxID=1034769 RepID=UPI00036765C5|nr:TetR/AcrR family transcriptional regulator [Paenibacillus sp. HW567]